MTLPGVLVTLAAMFVVGVTSSEVMNPDTMLSCEQRPYTYPLDKSIQTSSGAILRCFDNVTVVSCFGRCQSQEIPDYKVPYKLSTHPVCTYSGLRGEWVKLRHCHPFHPQPMAQIFHATGCACRPCVGDITSCQNLRG